MYLFFLCLVRMEKKEKLLFILQKADVTAVFIDFTRLRKELEERKKSDVAAISAEFSLFHPSEPKWHKEMDGNKKTDVEG